MTTDNSLPTPRALLRRRLSDLESLYRDEVAGAVHPARARRVLTDLCESHGLGPEPAGIVIANVPSTGGDVTPDDVAGRLREAADEAYGKP